MRRLPLACLQTIVDMAYTTTTSGVALALLAERATLTVRPPSHFWLPATCVVAATPHFPFPQPLTRAFGCWLLPPQTAGAASGLAEGVRLLSEDVQRNARHNMQETIEVTDCC